MSGDLLAGRAQPRAGVAPEGEEVLGVCTQEQLYSFEYSMEGPRLAGHGTSRTEVLWEHQE